MLVVPAYAKVNLALQVSGRRPDGWHDIATVIAIIDWHDLVGLRRRPRGEGEPPVSLRLSGPFAEGIPTGADNLAHRAAARLLDLASADQLALDVWVCKQVPAAAGLGGGSADAAAVLRAGAQLLAAAPAHQPRGAGSPAPSAEISVDHIVSAAAELGSDVPAVLAGRTLVATGRGEMLAPLPTAPLLHLAIAVAGPSGTAATYRALRPDDMGDTSRVALLAAALERGHHPDSSLLGSALEAPACRASDGLADSLARLRALTPGHRWHLTGSGGAAFALAPDANTASRIAATARAAGFEARAVRTIAHHPGPRPGQASR